MCSSKLFRNQAGLGGWCNLVNVVNLNVVSAGDSWALAEVCALLSDILLSATTASGLHFDNVWELGCSSLPTSTETWAPVRSAPEGVWWDVTQGPTLQFILKMFDRNGIRHLCKVKFFNTKLFLHCLTLFTGTRPSFLHFESTQYVKNIIFCRDMKISFGTPTGLGLNKHIV